MDSLQFLYIISTTTELLDLTSKFYVLMFIIFYMYVYCKNLRLTNVRKAQYKMMFVQNITGKKKKLTAVCIFNYTV